MTTQRNLRRPSGWQLGGWWLAVSVVAVGCQSKSPTASIPVGSPQTVNAAAGPLQDKSTGHPKITKEALEGDDEESSVDAPATAAKPSDDSAKINVARPGKTALRILEAPPQPLFPPTVVLSAGHERKCLVTVGDPLPALVTTNLSGQPQEVRDLFGEKLTVVVFWQAGQPYAREQFLRLQSEVAAMFEGTGVAVIALNVGDEPDLVNELYQRSGGKIDCLLDPQGEALAKVATDKLPRTYVVDAAGKILWLDMEYSRSTRRELENAVRYFLQSPLEDQTL